MDATGAIAAGSPVMVSPPRLVRAAHEFESQMMKELLEKMTDGGAFLGDGEEGSSSQALGQFAADALGRGLSERGGFGIATRIVAELSQSGSGARAGKVTTNPHDNTVMGGSE